MTSTRRLVSALLLALSLAVVRFGAAETFVLPAVVRGVPGINGSFWETEVRILRMSLQEPFVVRRVWVATAGGGFVDDPATAPRWEFPEYPAWNTPRLLQLRGAELLAGSGAPSGAVAIEVVGPAIVYLRSTNTASATPVPFTAAVTRGNGWLTLAPTTPLHGRSMIPWSTAGVAGWPEGYAYRTSVGLVNASATALDVQLRVFTLLAYNETPAGGTDWHFWRDSEMSQPLSVHVAPWGRVQLDDFFSTVWYCYPIGCYPGPVQEGPVLVLVEAPVDAGYYAYASQIFSALNDPEIVMAVPDLPEGIPVQ